MNFLNPNRKASRNQIYYNKPEGSLNEVNNNRILQEVDISEEGSINNDDLNENIGESEHDKKERYWKEMEIRIKTFLNY